MKILLLPSPLKRSREYVYDALIASDYIEEITGAWLPKGYNPDEYFTSIPEPTEICRIDNTLGSERGTIFKINIANREVFTLFDTGVLRSVMSGETFRKLNLNNKDLDTKNLPTVVGANSTSLGAIGRINCEIEIGRKRFKQTFLVCENLTRSLLLGVDFAKQHAAEVHWTKHNSFVLTIDGETVAETKELHNKAAVSLKKRTKLPPRSCAVVDMDINTTSTDKVQLVPDEYCIASNPNMYMYNLFADLSEKTKDSVTPFVIVNLSNDQYLEFPENHIVASAEKDDTEGEVFEIEQVDTTPRNWIRA